MTLLVLALLFVFPHQSPAQTIHDAVRAYVWANGLTVPSYTPNPDYSYVAGGGTTTITRSGVGLYRVTFNGLTVAGGGHVQVSSYANSAVCSPVSWGSNTVDVACYATNGTPSDSYFDVLFVGTASTPGVMYAWANDASSASYTPSSTYSYNGAGGAITAVRTAVGTYEMHFANVPASQANSGNVQVSPYASTAHCNATNWGAASGPSGLDLRIMVACYAPSGARMDSRYTVLFTTGSSPSRGTGYAWGNEPASASYVPNGTYRFNGSGGSVSVIRTSAGVYQMTFPGLGSNGGALGGHVQVTGYNTNARCNTAGWGSNGSAAVVSVECFDPAGAYVDAIYTVLFVWPGRVGVAVEQHDTIPAWGLAITGANPATVRTSFALVLPAPGQARLSVHDALGREVATLLNGALAAGRTDVAFDTSNLPRGVYLVRVVSGTQASTRVLTVVQ